MSKSSMTGRICLITGATSGIGRETALGLARLGATVVAAGRDPKKCASTVAQIRDETGNQDIDCLLADLSDQSQVRHLAGQFLNRYDRLDVLINNAGSFYFRHRESADSIEMTLALNYLCPFLLTHLLLPTLKASAPARIINVSSATHEQACIDFENLQGEKGYRPLHAYARSKLALLLFTFELARRLENTGVTANALHPGFVATNINTGGTSFLKILSPVIKLFARSPEEGAETGIYLASSPEMEGVTGQYLIDCAPVASSPASHDRETARRLWRAGRELTGLPPEIAI